MSEKNQKVATKTQISRGRMEDGSPHPVDTHVGKRLRLIRQALGISQIKLAKTMGITFQQIQKYEKGSDRISASRLWDFCRTLKQNINYFYADMDEETKKYWPPQTNNNPSDNVETFVVDDPMQKSETLELVTAYYKISKAKRLSLLNICKELARSDYYNNENSDDED